RIAAIDAVTGMASAWSQNAFTTEVLSVHASSSAIYVGWNGTIGSPVNRTGLAALDPATGAFTGWGPIVEHGFGVTCLLDDAGHVYAGGDFRSAGGALRHGLAALDETTGQLIGGPTVHGAIDAIAMSADSSVIYVAGTFDSIGGVARTDAAG